MEHNWQSDQIHCTRHRRLTLAAVLLALAALSQPGHAAAGDQTGWCALTQGPDGGYVTCDYQTRAQCLQALSGVGGVCHESPWNDLGRPGREPTRRPSRG